MTQTRVAILGATGYSGSELVRLLAAHPGVTLTYLSSESQAGQRLSEVYPHHAGRCDMTLQPIDLEAVALSADVAFLGLPAGVSTPLVPALVKAGLKVIDLGGDFRLADAATYETWYGKPAPDREVQAQAVYGLTELWPDEIRQARLITNPGCYPTAAILGLAPLLASGKIDSGSLIIDAKSGVSGAGRKATVATLFTELEGSFKAYKVGQHQHTPEIEQALGRIAGEPLTVSFTTHLLPITRGILATSYAALRGDDDLAGLLDLYRNFYEGRPFVRLLPPGQFPATKQVAGSNYCDIGLWLDERTRRITVVSVIDNLMKGAAGQAVQNFNLMHGFPETTALDYGPLFP